MANVVLALIFLVLILAFKTEGNLEHFFSFGLTINSLLAAFNMIPVMPFDGAKVINWNKSVYFVTTFTAIGLFITSFLI